jgi:CHAD domain-containing protein
VSDKTPGGRTASSLSCDDIVREFLGDEVGNLLHYDPIAREGEDPEGIHQLRVSCRRLRAELTVMYEVFQRDAIDRLLGELRWLGKTLGRRRDLDVRRALFEHVKGEMPRWLATSLLERLKEHTIEEDRRVQRLLDSDRYRHLMASLAEAVVRPHLNASALTPAADVLGAGLCDALSALVTKVEAVGPKPTFEQLHEIRIFAKRVRYSAALSSTLFAPRAKNIANSLEEVQTVLGELHDRVLALDYFKNEFNDYLVEHPSADLAKARARVERKLTREIKRLNTQWRQPYAEARRFGAALCRPSTPR